MNLLSIFRNLETKPYRGNFAQSEETSTAILLINFSHHFQWYKFPPYSLCNRHWELSMTMSQLINQSHLLHYQDMCSEP